MDGANDRSAPSRPFTDPIGAAARIRGVRVKPLLLPLLAAIVVAVLALSLSHGRSAPAATSASASGHTAHVKIFMYAFEPATLTVKPGTRVTWTNEDSTAHTATADQGAWDTGTINHGQSRTIDFMHPGTYTYHCSFHAFMTATIKVVG